MKSTSQTKIRTLKAERELRGWSQSKIAELLGTTTKTVGRWERGEAVPHPYYREQLCQLFGKNAQQLGWLPEGEEEQPLPVPKPEESEQPDHLSTMKEPWLLQDLAIPQTPIEENQLLGRSALFQQIKESLLAAESRGTLALTGLPGMGKTTLATALATDQQVREHFADGILWAALGPSANVLSQLMRWGKLLGVTASQVEDVKDQQAWSQALQAAIGSRRLLLIIDDVWTVEEALALQVGGPACMHILTTDQSQVASAFAPRRSLVVAPLEDADGLALLSCFIPHLVQQDSEEASKLVRAVEGIPLALTLMGKYLACQRVTGQQESLQITLAQLSEIQEHLQISISDGSEVQAAGYRERIPTCLYASIAICDHSVSPQAHAALCALSVLASKPESFSKEAALEVSQQSLEALNELIEVGLLQRWGADRYKMHQSVDDYIYLQQESVRAEKQVSTASIEETIPLQAEPYSSREPLSLPTTGGISHTSTRSTRWPRMYSSWISLLAISNVSLAIITIIALLLLFTKLPSPLNLAQLSNSTTVHPPSSTSYEANSPENTLTGAARVSYCSICYGGYRVGYIGHSGSVRFNKVYEKSAGTYTLTIYYLYGSGRTFYISVNSRPAIILHMPRTENWHSVEALNTTVNLNAGYNTIKFFNPSAYAPDLDRIIV